MSDSINQSRQIQQVVIHSGGMDSSICLAMARAQWGSDAVLSLSFDYGQRHSSELAAAKLISKAWGIEHHVMPISVLSHLSGSALVDQNQPITHQNAGPPSSWVPGRNGLMIRLAAMFAYQHGVFRVSTGVLERADAGSGYPDCSRAYVDILEQALRIDLMCPDFHVDTPLVQMSKEETYAVADQLGVLSFLLDHAVSCYEGLAKNGCGQCPACLLRQTSLARYQQHR